MERPQPDSIRISKLLPVVMEWGKKAIYLGELEFLKDGSLIFESAFHSSKEPGVTIDFGISNFKDGAFKNREPDATKPTGSGVHISLHPSSIGKRGVMHLREHHPGQIMYRRELDWHPVHKPFHLLRSYSPPLDTCALSQKKPTVTTKIDPNYKDSLELRIDIFPRSTEEHLPVEKSAEIWGFCPEYLVRVSIALANQRTPALIYWPDDDLVEL